MNDTVRFYYNPMSRARIAHWMLEEAGAPYETQLIDWRKQDQKSLAYLAINPMGKIPAIVHRGIVVTETAAICAYLADAFPKNNLAPALESPQRGTYYRWLFFTASCLEQALADRVSPHAGVARPMMLGYGTYEDTINTLEKAVSVDRYVAGPKFTAADVYVGSQIAWGLHFKTLPERPAFKLYLENLIERPAYKRAEAKALEFQAALAK